MNQKFPTDKSFSEDPLSDEHRVRIWCKIMRLQPDEGIRYMAQHGFKIGKDRYKQLLTEINKNVNKRLLYAAQKGFIEQHMTAIDLVENSLQILNNKIRLLETDGGVKDIHALERMIRLRNETAMLLSTYNEKTQYVLERQAQTRKLFSAIHPPNMAEPGSMGMTRELALELGITDYDEIVKGTGATPDVSVEN